MSFVLTCCPECNTWRKYDKDEEHHVCTCGCETFTESWILKHPEHPVYQKYLEFKAKEDANGKDIREGL